MNYSQSNYWGINISFYITFLNFNLISASKTLQKDDFWKA